MSPRGGGRNGDGGGSSRLREDWRQAWPGLGLVALVLGVLVLTAMLQDHGPAAPIDVETPPESVAAPPEEVPRVPDRSPVVETPPPRLPSPPPAAAPAPVRPRPATDDLDARSAEDYRRLSRRSGFTLQLMVACDAANARRELAAYLDRDALYVLPMDYGGRRCFRICWGVYGSESEAGAARDVPPALVARTGRPAVRAVALVTP